MSHGVYTRNLSRSRSLRKATVQSLTQSLLRHEQIETTLARAKETQRLAERLVTLGKDGSLHARRRALALLHDPDLVRLLFADVAPRFAQRQGGYTRILHGGYRPGDGASMAIIELVELKQEPKTKPKTAKEKRVEEKPAPKIQDSPKKAKEQPKKEEKPKKSDEKSSKTPEKPKGFLDGLRGFFKGRPNQ